MGNEALARGAIEAGVRGVFAYPGTPSTEISEIFSHISFFQNEAPDRELYPELVRNRIYFEYSVNEKIAMEKAIAYSLGNRNAMCVMKSAGLNVASDPLMTIAYQTLGAALVIVVCDDPGCYSSSNEQDSRHWGKMASVPVFNPITPDDALKMTKDAFILSAELKLPVIVRMSTRVDHSRGIVYYGKVTETTQKPAFEKSPQHLNIPARTAIAHGNLLKKLGSDTITPFFAKHNNTFFCREVNPASSPDGTLGIISCGAATVYALEIILQNNLQDRICLHKIGITHPFPAAGVIKFLDNGFSKVLILEELDPVVENEVRILGQKNRLTVEVYGKGFSLLTPVGEYNLDIVGEAIEEFTGHKLDKPAGLPAAGAERFLRDLPPRPPALCPGCPHRGTYYALKLAVDPDESDLIMCGDIGCFALGAFPPFQLIDTIHHMGMSISMAQGLSEAFDYGEGRKRKVVALVGDGTVFHSGVASILNAVYTRANITVIIFDNRTIGMTGQQYNPGSENPSRNRQVNLPALLRGLGVSFVESVDPNDIAGCYHAIRDAIAFDGVAAVIAKSPCVFLDEFKENAPATGKIEVDQDLCNTCHNQADARIYCSRDISAATSLTKARARLTAQHHIAAKEQPCPANICNHGFFNAILGGDYREALAIVRDKILFARICGDLCHKPCEFMMRGDDQPVVPIRRLKQFVAGIDRNFSDFTVQKTLTAATLRKGLKIAIIGAGPAGLSAAYDLIQAGYEVTVFEKENEAGGLLKFAIPAFRMDKDGFDTEISALTDLGVEFRFGAALGDNISLNGLKQDFDGVLLAIGMGKSSTLDMVEKNLPPECRFDAITFLRRYNEDLLEMKPGARVFVIGGGNSAVDAARAAKKTGADVTIIYRRSRAEMPAFDEEIESALSEGVIIVNDCIIGDCKVNKSGEIKVILKSFRGDQERGELHGDYIISAVGQEGNADALKATGLKTNDAMRLIVDPSNCQVESTNVFVAGDICADNHVSIIGAIASGKKAATGLRQLLEGYAFDYEGLEALNILNSPEMARLKSQRYPDEAINETYLRDELPSFDLYQVCGKCDHCIENFGCPALIKVDGKVVIDDHQCNSCGLCIDVCLNRAIHRV